MDSDPNTTSRQPPHPRRPPAHQSVSLRHDYPASRGPSTAPASDQANPPSTISSRSTANKQSSGESSDTSHWYEHRNDTAVQSSASFVDNDPPFFLRTSSSSETPPEGYELRSAYMPHLSTTMPHRPEMGRRDTDGSSAHEFRSVIDDLTVANKKLKQKLRKYEKLYDAHLQEEKLFEVRFHGLPDHKKKELEEQLRKFAADLDGSPETAHKPTAYGPPRLPQMSTNSQVSRVAESGYASMSASGQENDRRRISKSQYNQQQQNIHSYLHDPTGLLPKRNAPMTEKAKKKLVVRRLEQIFAGTRSAPGSHPQPMQQEEVAQSAAMADRRAKEATGQRSTLEGLREARIMPSQSEEDEHDMFAFVEVLSKRTSHLVSDYELAGSGSPDQRPTRPLDLDPYRAQVPTENIQYIRHLGFTPPDIISGGAPGEGHGWLYLNLLINMAQLHTMNVTPDFVKDAVSEFSSKFELSNDGHKIRWRGDQDVHMGSSDSSPGQFANSPLGVIATSPKRLKLGDRLASSESIYRLEQEARRVARALKKKEQGRFAYTPLFFHKDDSDDSDDCYNLDQSSSNNSPFFAQPRGDSSEFASSGMQSSFEQKRRRDDGPIIFYNKAKFCTDLSGDRRGFAASMPTDYKDATSQPLGTTPQHAPSIQLIPDISEPRGPFANSSFVMEMKESETTSSSESEFGFFPEALRNDTGSEESTEIMDFEASGLGGVHPDDNFSIKVRRSQTQTAPSSLAYAPRYKANRYPRKILEALQEQPLHEGAQPRNQASMIRTELVSAHQKFLPSSTLPPPSYMPFGSPSSCPDDSDEDSDISSDPSSHESDDEEQPDPATQLQLLNIAAPTRVGSTYAVNAGNEHAFPSSLSEASSEESESDDEDEDDSDDESVDFLATARKLDPKSVLASEREYDAAVAERLAEKILAGSSAATAGGRSGFGTPIGGIGMAVIQEKAESADEDMSSTADGSNVDVAGSSVSAGTRASLKRSRTSEIIAKLSKVQRK